MIHLSFIPPRHLHHLHYLERSLTRISQPWQGRPRFDLQAQVPRPQHIVQHRLFLRLQDAGCIVVHDKFTELWKDGIQKIPGRLTKLLSICPRPAVRTLRLRHQIAQMPARCRCRGFLLGTSEAFVIPGSIRSGQSRHPGKEEASLGVHATREGRENFGGPGQPGWLRKANRRRTGGSLKSWFRRSPCSSTRASGRCPFLQESPVGRRGRSG